METFRRLIEAYSQAAKEKDVNGCLLLHHAGGLNPNRSHDFVSELLKIYPAAAQLRDDNEELPLRHMQKYFCFCCGVENATVEKTTVELIETYPDALLQSNG